MKSSTVVKCLPMFFLLTNCRVNKASDHQSSEKVLYNHDSESIDAQSSGWAFLGSSFLASRTSTSGVIAVGLALSSFESPVKDVFSQLLDQKAHFQCKYNISNLNYTCDIYKHKDGSHLNVYPFNVDFSKKVGKSVISPNRISICQLQGISVTKGSTIWNNLTQSDHSQKWVYLSPNSNALLPVHAVSLVLKGNPLSGFSVDSLQSSIGDINNEDIDEVNLNNSCL